MSYNITRFVLKSVDATIPTGIDLVSFFHSHRPNDSWQTNLVEVNFAKEEWSWDNGRGLDLSGVITDDGLKITDVECSGEGSGSNYSEILLPLFEMIKGNLHAVCVWEGGDEITRLRIVDGVAEEEDVDL